jgi:hypothetical protein
MGDSVSGRQSPSSHLLLAQLRVEIHALYPSPNRMFVDSDLSNSGQRNSAVLAEFFRSTTLCSRTVSQHFSRGYLASDIRMA